MSAPDSQLDVPQGRFSLQRLPRRRRELLRAWDAADEYLLTEIGDILPGLRVLVVNDSFGALAVALAGAGAATMQSWSDSWLSQQATRLNLAANNLPEDAVRLIDSVDEPTPPWGLVVIRVPKVVGLLETQLRRLKPLLAPTTRILVAGMIKALPKSLWEVLERVLGPTDTQPGWKKAKLIRVMADPALPLGVDPYPVSYRLEGTDWTLCNHANVFSRDGLDIGTRFFLQHLPTLPAARDIVDLGCGNGVVGLLVAHRHPDAAVHFVDESHMAVASARHNVAAVLGGTRPVSFQVGDGLADAVSASVDLVLCNPPFHQQQAVSDHIALRMFRQAHRALRPGGALWVVGNRHLRHDITLKQTFGAVELVASNAKFVILKASRRA